MIDTDSFREWCTAEGRVRQIMEPVAKVLQNPALVEATLSGIRDNTDNWIVPSRDAVAAALKEVLAAV
jgi:hypothetical protein